MRKLLTRPTPRFVLSGLTLALALGVIFDALFAASTQAAENWAEFRGPGGTGHAAAGNYPVEWSETDHVRWKTPIHDKGWSSPVVWQDLICLTTATADGKQMFALAIHRDDGRILWDRKLFDNEKPGYCPDMNSFASPTPVIEEGRVYVHFGSYGTACLDASSGDVIWQRRDLPCDHWRAPASSPILFRNLLIMAFDGYDKQYIVALDKSSGETVWKRDRSIEYRSTDGDMKKAFGTPSIVEIDGGLQMISSYAEGTTSYHPLTGEEFWTVRHGGMNASSRPQFGDGLVYVHSGDGGHQLVAARTQASREGAIGEIAWTAPRVGGTRSSPVLVGDLLFLVNNIGVGFCVDARTGEVEWQKRLGGQGYSASPVYADGRLYFFSEEGASPVIEPAREFKEIRANRLADGCMATPAFVDGSIFIRTRTALYRVD